MAAYFKSLELKHAVENMSVNSLSFSKLPRSVSLIKNFKYQERTDRL